MITHFGLEQKPAIARAVVTTGTFDGVHLGHRSILDRIKELARETGGESVVVTFEPHPRIVLKKDVESLRLLNTIDEKAGLLQDCGVDHLVVIPFTTAFSQLSQTEFIRDVLVEKMGAAAIVVGYDHRFGSGRAGDFHTLESLSGRFGFRIEEIAEKTAGENKVSSTRIRNALFIGNVRLAAELLGYHYMVTGTVAEGAKMGRKLGFPTANLALNSPYKLIPARGVYAVKAVVGERMLGGMCNIGIRPTFNQQIETIETHLFDFSGDLYGEALRIQFIERLRDEKKFAGIDELKDQLEKDMAQAKTILSEHVR